MRLQTEPVSYTHLDVYKRQVQTLESEQFTDRAVADSCYPNHDFHDLYIAEIQKALVR